MRNMTAVASFAAAILAFSSAPASADVVLPFSLQGLFIYTQSSPLQTGELFTGTLIINTTTGMVEDFYSSLGSTSAATQGSVPGSNTYSWRAYVSFAPNNINIVFATTSLIGFTGSDLVTVNDPDLTGNYTSITQVHVPTRVLISGSVTPLPVPEPSSLAILAAGAVGSVTLRGWGSRFLRSRRRRASHAE